MKTEDVLERFAIIASLTDSVSSKWSFIVEDAVAEIKSKLKSDIDENINGRRLTAAAAALSFYKYTLYKAASDELESFSAGDISIKSNCQKSIEIAFSVWNEAKKSILDLLNDDEFYFEQVVFI